MLNGSYLLQLGKDRSEASTAGCPLRISTIMRANTDNYNITRALSKLPFAKVCTWPWNRVSLAVVRRCLRREPKGIQRKQKDSHREPKGNQQIKRMPKGTQKETWGDPNAYTNLFSKKEWKKQRNKWILIGFAWPFSKPFHITNEIENSSKKQSPRNMDVDTKRVSKCSQNRFPN